MWLTSPSTSCPSPAASVCSTSPSGWLCQALASSATLSGKPTAPKSWRLALKRKEWLRRLAGRICEPSTASRGVESWIASLRATRANHFHTPASVLGSAIRGICGPTSPASLRRFVPASCSLRTSLGTSLWDSPSSDESSKAWAIELRRDCLRRQKSARRTGGRGCSSLQWTTARAEDAESCGNHPGAVDSLTGAVSVWPTPGANDHKGSAEMGQRRGQLDELAEHWPTPNVPDRGPETRSSKAARRSGGVDLQTTVEEWQTPNSCGATTRKQVGRTEREALLPRQAEQWQTPQTMGGGSTRSGDRKNEPLITAQARTVSASSLPAPATTSDGGPSSPSVPTSRRRLNPDFVDWLMGWPIGMTDSGRAATGLSLWRARTRSALCGLLCRSDA